MYTFIYIIVFTTYNLYSPPHHHPLDSHPSCLQLGQEMLGLQAAAEFTLDLIRASTGSLQMSGQGRKKNG